MGETLKSLTKFAAALAISAGVAVAAPSGASAAVMTFDALGSFATYTEAGMTITPISGSSAVTLNGAQWDLLCCNFGNYDFEFTTGGTFNFLSIFFEHTDTGDPVTFRGYIGATEIASQVVDGANVGLVSFSGFTDVDRVTVNFAGFYRDAIMDNLTFAVANGSPPAVPAPHGLAAVAAGLLGFAALRRKRG